MKKHPYKSCLNLVIIGFAIILLHSNCSQIAYAPNHEPEKIMMYADASRGRPFSKDPDVVWFNGTYLMYFSIPPFRDGRPNDGWNIGIAQSSDLTNWTKAGEIQPGGEYEKNGLCAPAAIVLKNQVHLFYQTYGNREKDAICHAFSSDGIHFTRNSTNPIFSPTGSWTCGRAIDADVFVKEKKLLLYFATRDTTFKIQMLGVASAPLHSDYGRSRWTQQCDSSILKPELPWEKTCIEAPAVFEHHNRYYMFYAGAYNNQPQQIGCAVSQDGISWTRISDQPVLPNGKPGEWNSSESGHPGVFVDGDGQQYLFFQGNNDFGKTWYLSKKRIEWKGDQPFLID